MFKEDKGKNLLGLLSSTSERKSEDQLYEGLAFAQKIKEKKKKIEDEKKKKEIKSLKPDMTFDERVEAKDQHREKLRSFREEREKKEMEEIDEQKERDEAIKLVDEVNELSQKEKRSLLKDLLTSKSERESLLYSNDEEGEGKNRNFVKDLLTSKSERESEEIVNENDKGNEEEGEKKTHFLKDFLTSRSERTNEEQIEEGMRELERKGKLRPKVEYIPFEERKKNRDTYRDKLKLILNKKKGVMEEVMEEGEGEGGEITLEGIDTGDDGYSTSESGHEDVEVDTKINTEGYSTEKGEVFYLPDSDDEREKEKEGEGEETEEEREKRFQMEDGLEDDDENSRLSFTPYRRRNEEFDAFSLLSDKEKNFRESEKVFILKDVRKDVKYHDPEQQEDVKSDDEEEDNISDEDEEESSYYMEDNDLENLKLERMLNKGGEGDEKNGKKVVWTKEEFKPRPSIDAKMRKNLRKKVENEEFKEPISKEVIYEKDLRGKPPIPKKSYKEVNDRPLVRPNPKSSGNEKHDKVENPRGKRKIVHVRSPSRTEEVMEMIETKKYLDEKAKTGEEDDITNPMESIDNVVNDLTYLINKHKDEGNEIVINHLRLFYEYYKQQDWNEGKHGRLTTFLRENEKFTFVKVSPGKHKVCVGN